MRSGGCNEIGGRGAGLWVLAGTLLLSGCGRYADFTLPVVGGGDPNLTFRFEAQAEPVLARGRFSDVLNPSVIAVHGMPYRNLYSVFDGRTWHTALAASDDGSHWQQAGIVLSPEPKTWESDYSAANGSGLWHEKEFLYWYVAGPEERPRLGLARSTNARTWRKEPAPVLEPGPYASWDEYGAADPYVIRIDPYFYMYYLGQDRAGAYRVRQRLGLARSTDGIHWEKLRSNPILDLGADGEFDEAGLGEPAVWNWHGFYWMLYTGRDIHENRRLGLARSTDGVRWRKLPAVIAGTEAWDSKVVCDPTVVVEGDTIRVWFGGGDVASPDENLHGQIGYGALRPVNATLAK